MSTNESARSTETLGATGTVTVTSYDVETGEQLSQQTVNNTPCIGWARWGSEQQQPTAQPDVPTRLALGTGTATPDYADEQVAGPAGTTDVAAVERPSESEVLVAAFLDSTELNGFTLTRMGVQTESGHLLNHAEIAPLSKTQSKVVNLQITLSYIPPSP